MSSAAPESTGDLRDRTIRGGSALLVGQGFRFAISLASQIVLARLLFPEDFGLVAMVYPVLGFIQLFQDFGLLQAVVQRPAVSPRLLNAIFWVNTAICLGLALVFAALAPVLALVYHEPRVTPIAIVLSAMILVTGASQLPSALLGRQLRFVLLVVVDIVSLAVGLVVGIACALSGKGYWSLVFSQVATTVTASALTILAARWRPSAPNRDPEVGGMLKFGGQITAAKVVIYLNSSVDNMMIGVVLGERSLGLYDRAWRLAVMPLVQLCAPVDRLAMPVLSRLQDDPARYRRAFGQMIQLLCLLAMPGLLYGVVGAGQFIPVLLGPKWLDTVPIFGWVCFGALISPLNNAAFWLLTSQGRGSDQLRWTTVVSVINIAAYASGLYWGIKGVAMASAISVYTLQAPILISAATRSGPVDRAAYVRAVWPVLAAIALTAPVLYGLVVLLARPSLVHIIVTGGAAYALPFLILAAFPRGRTTLAMVWAALPAKLSRRFAPWVPGWLTATAG